MVSRPGLDLLDHNADGGLGSGRRDESERARVRAGRWPGAGRVHSARPGPPGSALRCAAPRVQLTRKVPVVAAGPLIQSSTGGHACSVTASAQRRAGWSIASTAGLGVSVTRKKSFLSRGEPDKSFSLKS